MNRGAYTERNRRSCGDVLTRRNGFRVLMLFHIAAVCTQFSGCSTVNRVMHSASNAKSSDHSQSAISTAPSAKPQAETGPADITPRIKPPRERRETDNAAKSSEEISLLLGLSSNSVAEMLGQPHVAEKNGASLIWNYSASECSLQIVFYPDIGDETYHVLQYALIDGNGETPKDAQPCLDQIYSAHQDGNG